MFFQHNQYLIIVRTLAWLGIAAVVILSVIPADERPVPGNWISFIGHELEHFAAFAVVAGTFAVGYRFTLSRLTLLALLFCGGIELLQIPLPTRHARVSDFIIDFIGASFAIGLVAVGDKFLMRWRTM
jgi:VanZ family protein